MADTVGLLKTRDEWTSAQINGETKLSHKEWYEQKYGPKSSIEAMRRAPPMPKKLKLPPNG